MNTSAFSFYLLPFVFRRWWKQKQGTSVDSRVANEYQPLALDEDIAEVDTCYLASTSAQFFCSLPRQGGIIHPFALKIPLHLSQTGRLLILPSLSACSGS